MPLAVEHYYASAQYGGGIKGTTSVCRVHREYSWHPQLLEARRAGRRRRKACWATVCGVEGQRHIVLASRTACS